METVVGKPRIRLEVGAGYRFVREVVRSNRLHTVCEEARCPNIFECWSRRTATLMILGDVCTRSCGFCAVQTGRPAAPDPLEPLRTARAVQRMGLRHVVLTSVDRDDLKEDYGSTLWAATIHQIRRLVPTACTVEVLTPDFRGYRGALQRVLEAGPDIFAHNVECIQRISRRVRPQADWQRSLEVLARSVSAGLVTKTGMMVGLGESFEEVVETMRQVAGLGVEIFTIGQYLQPSREHLAVQRYVAGEEFEEYRRIGLELGFRIVESGALVRSSYHADEQARLIQELE